MSSGDSATSRPRTRRRPRSGTMNPSSDLIIVLLPAPLGPSSPTAPAANDDVTSRSARFFPYVTVTPSSVTTGSPSAIHFLIRKEASQRSSKSELVSLLPHEADRVRDVLLEGETEQRGARVQVFPLHAAAERLVLHPLDHRFRLEVEDALARTDQRRARDEPGELVAGKQRLFEQAVARHAGDLHRMRQNRADRPLGIALRAQNLGPLV